jgi:hypothetical protein
MIKFILKFFATVCVFIAFFITLLIIHFIGLKQKNIHNVVADLNDYITRIWIEK